MNKIRKRLTYANVMSTIAVFFAVGGATAFAATQVLPKNSVGPRQIQQNAVRTGKIAGEAVRAGKIAKNAITTNRLRDGSVSAEKIVPEAVGPQELAKNGVTTQDIANNAVTTEKINKAAVTAEKLATDSVTTEKIANNAVTGAKIANNSISTGKIVNSSVTASKLAPGAASGNLSINVRSENTVIGPTVTGLATSQCAAGEKLIGIGTVWVPPVNLGHSIEEQFYFGTTAVVRANNETAAAATLTVQAVCIAG